MTRDELLDQLDALIGEHVSVAIGAGSAENGITAPMFMFAGILGSRERATAAWSTLQRAALGPHGPDDRLYEVRANELPDAELPVAVLVVPGFIDHATETDLPGGAYVVGTTMTSIQEAVPHA